MESNHKKDKSEKQGEKGAALAHGVEAQATFHAIGAKPLAKADLADDGGIAGIVSIVAIVTLLLVGIPRGELFVMVAGWSWLRCCQKSRFKCEGEG